MARGSETAYVWGWLPGRTEPLPIGGASVDLGGLTRDGQHPRSTCAWLLLRAPPCARRALGRGALKQGGAGGG